MFCIHCGKPLDSSCRYCIHCGKYQGKDWRNPETVKTLCSNKGVRIGAIVLAVLLAVACISAMSSPSIVGVWVSDRRTIRFTESGEFQYSDIYGTYTVTDKKTLILETGVFSWTSGYWEYEYDRRAMDSGDGVLGDGYWYRKGNTLYLNGYKFTK